MNKERLKELGLTDEQSDKVMESLSSSFVPKTKLDEALAENRQLKASLKERDGQLEALKTESGTAEKLRTQIAELQAANAEKDKAHAAEMKKLKREAVDEKLLTEAHANHPLAVAPFLAAIDDSVDDEGYAALRKQQIEALVKADSTKFLFKPADEEQSFTGMKPGETGVKQPTNGAKNPFAKDSYDEAAQIKLFRENPDLARTLARQAGITYI